jgi:uncharacterized protein DUF6624
MHKLIILLSIILSFIVSNSQEQEISITEMDSLIKNRLELILVKDQTLRLLLPSINEKFGVNSPEQKYFWSLIDQQDSINELEITKIIDDYGWLGVNKIGEKANQCIWLVIQHAPLKSQEKYLPHLKVSVEKGESDGWYLAFLEDRILMRKGEKQFYGSQAVYNKETGKSHIYQISDVDNVNIRRKKLGMESMEEYAEMNGYILYQETP